MQLLFVGTSGFSYTSWRGRFYPKDLKSEEFLSYYSKNLNSVEINSSFYAAPNASIVRSWSEKTGDQFRFAFKVPRQITHILRLGKGALEATERLEETLRLLETKKGPLLFQLPPYLRQDIPLLESFLLNTTGLRERVFEFRHESWLVDDTYRVLDKYDASFCIAETEDMAPVFQVTGGMAYFRLRKEVYSEEMIEEWVHKINKTVRGVPVSYVFLRHDKTGENVALALKLLEKL